MERDLTIPEANLPSILVRPTEGPEASANRPPSSTARPPSSPRAVWQCGAVWSPASAEESPERPTPEVAAESEPPLQEPQHGPQDETPSEHETSVNV